MVETLGTSTIEPRPDGSVTRTLLLPLARFAPGRYALHIEVRDAVTGVHREQLEPFELEESE